MDIMPEYLLKAIVSRDIDRMEALGIYEVAPEDFALCRICRSVEDRNAVCSYARQADYLRKETE